MPFCRRECVFNVIIVHAQSAAADWRSERWKIVLLIQNCVSTLRRLRHARADERWTRSIFWNGRYDRRGY